MPESIYEELQTKIAHLERWVDDLQSGMWINCVYCGHRYGPEDQVAPTMGVALMQHVAACPKHPMANFVRLCRLSQMLFIELDGKQSAIPDRLLKAAERDLSKALASIDQLAPPDSSRKIGFTFIEVLFAVIILGIGFIMIAAMFSVAVQQTAAVSTDTRAMQILRNATQAVQSATERPGTSALLPGVFNSHQMPIITPVPQAMMSQVGGQFIGSDNRYGFVCFYRRDSIANPFCQLFTIALQNSNFPLYSQPIPIPPSLYGAAQPTTPTIEGTLSSAGASSSITFAASVVNAAGGAFLLIADDETLPQATSWKDSNGVVHNGFIYNNAPLTGRLLRLGAPLSAPTGTIAFSLEPGKDLLSGDMAALASDGNSTGKVMVWMIGAAPLSNPAAGDFSGAFTGPNQDVGANSSFCAIVK